MPLYPTSDTSNLTPEQHALLDDTFFESNPASYWRARIDDLLREPTPIDYREALAAQVTSYGLDERLLSTTKPTEAERELQRALDAFTLRHHLAESLVRMVHAVLAHWKMPGSRSIWPSLASNRDTGHDLVQALRAFEDQGEVPANLFMPATNVRALPSDPPADVEAGVRMHWQWVRRAMHLLVSEGLDANVGNNKLKHGLAVRPHNELRVSFVAGSPPPDGNVRLSTVESASSIIDATAIEFLERLPSRHEHAGSWEVTVLNLRPAPLIAESLMLSTVWASVFASAAADRFVGPDEAKPKHPGLVLGPPPDAIVREIVGYRQALTISDKSQTSRGLAVETSKGIVGLTQTGPGTNGTIVAD
ncbi:hypothetical protein GB931_02830 [Modestobacter sp. I12A-02628]|uniref:Uncharacterized protein n=1 Tax=Goekera deserti TaxID=2497753 RepID=A0A7K3WFV9_9ACTN|nr:hypothetical protein [Goekera deserti]MPQ96872.1 hypothetical protein [Goekera deserti]NDI46815.1 hypothetical protein [Goekera deserti]NEL54383.1 hypothetical protein [Goekera deserti]